MWWLWFCVLVFGFLSWCLIGVQVCVFGAFVLLWIVDCWCLVVTDVVVCLWRLVIGVCWALCLAYAV